MLALGDVFDSIDDDFHRCTHAKQELIHHRHEYVFHVRSKCGDELKIEGLLQFFAQFQLNPTRNCVNGIIGLTSDLHLYLLSKKLTMLVCNNDFIGLTNR
jgi:hypothetical protein